MCELKITNIITGEVINEMFDSITAAISRMSEINYKDQESGKLIHTIELINKE